GDAGGTGDAGATDGGGDAGGGDAGATGGGNCPNNYDPMGAAGWTKTYSASFTWSGDTASSGTATETGLGPQTLVDGSSGYAYTDSISTSGESYAVTTYVGCDRDGDEGMFIVAWDGTYDGNMSGIPIAVDVNADLTPPRKYLPAGYQLGALGSWDYSYSLNLTYQMDTGAPTSSPYTIYGSYVEAGFTDLTLFDGTTVSAYKLVNTYTKNDGTTETNGYIEQYWVAGLGLVQETHVNMDTGATIASKVLTGYSGLTIMD
ncbi:MAG: hypothetical protein GXP62_08945, partial [Oligoflexia bacterium]|nr:hypothetical protein [Oligoflexia bacterium]